MTYVNWKLEHTPYSESLKSWDNSKTSIITSFNNPSLIINIGDRRDSLQFDKVNFNGNYNNFFKGNDRIIVSRTINSDVFTDNDILMTASVKDAKDTIDSKSSKIKVDAYNLSETIASAIVFIDVVDKTPPEIIKQALNWLALKNTNFKVDWSEDNDDAISSLTFPTYSEKFFNVTLKSILEKYSANTKTNNGNFYWYVDKNNKFIWRPPTSTISSTFDYESDTSVTGIKTGKDISQVKNYFIMKGGLDAGGSQIQQTYIDWGSVAKHGIKFQLVISENNTAKQLIDSDIKTSYGTEPSPDGYPNITSSSFTTSWRANYNYTVDGVFVVKGSFITINRGFELLNRSTYNAIIRKEIKERLKTEGQFQANSLKFGKLQCSITCRAGRKNYGLGDLISVNIPQLSSSEKALRLVEIQFGENTDVYTFEEDKGSL